MNTNFAKAPAPWIAALRRSHDRLRMLVDPLDVEQHQEGSYDSEWSIAQVLSHLGSGAEIFSLFLDAGLSGDDPPGRETFLPIREAWTGRSPPEQAADALEADKALLERFESLDAAQQWRFRLPLFRRVRVSTSDPERQLVLEVGEAVTLGAWDAEESLPEVRLPAEAFLRLVYGRLDPAHTPPLETGAVDLDELRAVFPGF